MAHHRTQRDIRAAIVSMSRSRWVGVDAVVAHCECPISDNSERRLARCASVVHGTVERLDARLLGRFQAHGRHEPGLCRWEMPNGARLFHVYLDAGSDPVLYPPTRLRGWHLQGRTTRASAARCRYLFSSSLGSAKCSSQLHHRWWY